MIALIVAYTKNRVIGYKGHIPWNIKGEQKRFKELTLGNVVIMGRRTFEEIGKPLKNRITIVVSNTKTYEDENCFTVHTLKEAIELVKDKDIFICGGEKLYQEALSYVDKLFITEIDYECEGDTFFPFFNENNFIKEINGIYKGEISYRYVTYTRK